MHRLSYLLAILVLVRQCDSAPRYSSRSSGFRRDSQHKQNEDSPPLPTGSTEHFHNDQSFNGLNRPINGQDHTVRTSPHDSYDDDALDDYEYQTQRKRPAKGRRKGNEHHNGESMYVRKYTESLLSKLVVASTSAIGAAIVSMIITSMLLSSSSPLLSLVFATVGAAATFTNSEIGEFARSLGVFVILVALRARLTAFLARFVSQLKPACLLATRRPYPPCENPWQYTPEEEELDINFSMTTSLLAVIMSSAYIGWLIARPIPLFPNWIGAIGAAVVAGGATNVRDSRGDVLRFLGHSINRCFITLLESADDVLLREKTAVLLSRMLFFLKGVDNKYHIVDKLKLLIAAILNQITRMAGRVKADMGKDREGMAQYFGQAAGDDDGDDVAPIFGVPPRKRGNLDGSVDDELIPPFA